MAKKTRSRDAVPDLAGIAAQARALAERWTEWRGQSEMGIFQPLLDLAVEEFVAALDAIAYHAGSAVDLRDSSTTQPAPISAACRDLSITQGYLHRELISAAATVRWHGLKELCPAPRRWAGHA